MIRSTTKPQYLDDVISGLNSFWTSNRLNTLGRIAIHKRQFEAWWKWELATFLWEIAEKLDLDVFVESNKRADITLATPIKVKGGTYIAPKGICIPIELKTTGTWWGKTPSLITKALDEKTKKRLSHDLEFLAQSKRRADPFGLVVLLVTHDNEDKSMLTCYVEKALKLASLHDVKFLGEKNPFEILDVTDNQTVLVQQLIWGKW
jgi:hypothetical protein